MNETFLDVVQMAERYALPISLVLLASVIIIFFSRDKIKSGWLNVKTKHRLKRLGFKQVSNFRCPDGLGYYFVIDRLILRRDCITLLMNKNFPGKIYCADEIDDWTQMLGQQSFRFKNPLYDLGLQVKAVSACVPDVPVDGLLFFDHQAEFPKGHPDSVIYLTNIPEGLKRTKGEGVEASVLSAWENLLRMEKIKESE
jgi:hypothetical protein